MGTGRKELEVKKYLFGSCLDWFKALSWSKSQTPDICGLVDCEDNQTKLLIAPELYQILRHRLNEH